MTKKTLLKRYMEL